MHFSTVKTDGKIKVQPILGKYSTVFDDGIGKVEGIKATQYQCFVRLDPYLTHKIQSRGGNGELKKHGNSTKTYKKLLNWQRKLLQFPRKMESQDLSRF